MESGYYPTLSNHDYHSDPAISRSGVMSFLDSPYKYWADYLNPAREAKEPTPAMEFGTAFHTLVLETEKWGDIYSVMPEKKLLRDVGQAEYDKNESRINAVKQNLCKATIISMKEYKLLLAMHEALMTHPRAKDLIIDNQYEQSFFWRDIHTGLMCKARPDILSDNYVVDLKTIANASPFAFQRAMAEGGFHIQFAMMRDAIYEVLGKDIKTFINICVEKTYPYQIGIYIIDDEALEIGRQEYKQALLDMKSCFEQKEWPSYPIQTIGLPNWRKK